MFSYVFLIHFYKITLLKKQKTFVSIFYRKVNLSLVSVNQTSVPPHEKVVYDKQTQTLHTNAEKEGKFALLLNLFFLLVTVTLFAS